MHSKTAPVLIAIAAVLVLALSELLYPLPESLKVDVVAGLGTLLNGRVQLSSIAQRRDSVRSEMRALEDSLAKRAFKPSRASEDSLYLVVDTHTNQLFVRRGSALLRACPAATGSNRELSGAGQRWLFATPRGIMTVRDKRVDPVWVMPDWAFVEKGEDVPPLESKERLVPDHLGDYALILGGGIMIHGTTDIASLGRNASHGCIRLGKEDLRYVYEMADIGTKVYVF
jgi:L,D-transpeptidase YbiS